MYDILELSKKLLPELKDIAKDLQIKKAESLKKQDLIYKILDQQAVDSTENKVQTNIENTEPNSEETPSPTEVRNTSTEVSESESEVQSPESDSNMESEAAAALRRGKRPRTLKPIIKRSVESVMSVSPDGVKRPDTRQ